MKEVAVLSAPVAGIIAAILLANMILMLVTSYNRCQKDFMFGPTGYKYTGAAAFSYDLKDDRCGWKGVIRTTVFDRQIAYVSAKHI